MKNIFISERAMTTKRFYCFIDEQNGGQMILKKSLALAALLFCASIARGAETPGAGTISWEECVKRAEMNNPDIISARETILQQEAATGVARAPLLPQVTATASGQRNYTTGSSIRSGSSAYGSSTVSNSFAYGIEAKQLLFDGFKSYFDLQSAKTKESASHYNYLIASSTVRLNLRTAFVNLLKAQELVPIAKEIETRRKHIMDLVKLHYDSGTDHIGSYHSAKADYASAQADTASAERNLLAAQKKLATLMGLGEETIFTAAGRLALPDRYETRPDLAALASNNPAAKKAALAKEAAAYDARSAMLDFSPRIYGFAGAEKNGDSFPPSTTNYYLGVSVSAPLFSGGSTYYTMKKADAAGRQSDADEKSARAAAFRSLDAAWNALRDSIENVGVQNQYLSAAVERSKIGEVQYLTGSLSFNNWTILESNLVNAKKSYLEASAEVLRAEAVWIQSIGGALENETQK
jgi:outer membrane protein TolC